MIQNSIHWSMHVNVKLDRYNQLEGTQWGIFN